MSTFDEIQFPPEIAEGAAGGPEFSTVVISTASGAEQRVGMWSNGRLKWDVSQGLRTPTQMTALVAFFRARHGKLRGFRFKDWTDYTAVLQVLVNPYPATIMQLTKTYTDGIQVVTRLIAKPVNGTLQLYQNGVLLVEGTAFTCDYTSGIITFLSGYPVSGDTYTWSGQFDVPVRFDTDDMKYTAASTGYLNWNTVPVIELLAGSY